MSVSLSYRLSQEHNAQSLLWDGCSTMDGAVRKTAAIVGRVAGAVTHFLPLLLLALALTVGLAVVVATVAMIPPVFWLGLAITGAFGWATYPRTKAVRK